MSDSEVIIELILDIVGLGLEKYHRMNPGYLFNSYGQKIFKKKMIGNRMFFELFRYGESLQIVVASNLFKENGRHPGGDFKSTIKLHFFWREGNRKKYIKKKNMKSLLSAVAHGVNVSDIITELKRQFITSY